MNLRLQALAALIAIAGIGAVHAQGVTRAQVTAELQKSRATGQLHRNDWYDELASRPVPGTDETRKDVIAQARAARALRAKLAGPLRDRSYNPYQVELLSWRSDLHTRAEIKHEELVARREGLLVPAGEAPVPMATTHHTAFYAAN